MFLCAFTFYAILYLKVLFAFTFYAILYLKVLLAFTFSAILSEGFNHFYFLYGFMSEVLLDFTFYAIYVKS